VITYPPHTSHTFQVLDVLLFGALTGAKKYQRRDDSLASNIDHVLRLFRAYEIAPTSTTIKSSWARTGFGYQARNITLYLVVKEDRIKAADGFREVRQFDCHPNRLSQRRAAQKWGWINEHLFRRRREWWSSVRNETVPWPVVKIGDNAKWVSLPDCQSSLNHCGDGLT
jgi:hypothetical protein